MADGPSEEPHGEPFIQAGGDVDRFRVSLAIHGDELDPDEITRLLRCQPTHAHRKGEARRGRSANTVPWRAGAWVRGIEGESPRTVANGLTELLEQLPEDDRVWSELTRSWSCTLRIGLFLDEWNRGFWLAPRLVERLARMRVEVDLSIYAPDRFFDDD